MKLNKNLFNNVKIIYDRFKLYYFWFLSDYKDLAKGLFVKKIFSDKIILINLKIIFREIAEKYKIFLFKFFIFKILFFISILSSKYNW